MQFYIHNIIKFHTIPLDIQQINSGQFLTCTVQLHMVVAGQLRVWVGKSSSRRGQVWTGPTLASVDVLLAAFP